VEFFGDEGKGKIIVYLALKNGFSLVARGGVGPCGTYFYYKWPTF
jgi:adenylosuccinate synthase